MDKSSVFSSSTFSEIFNQLIKNKKAENCFSCQARDDLKISLHLQMGFLYNIGLTNSISYYFLYISNNNTLSLYKENQKIKDFEISHELVNLSNNIFLSISENFMNELSNNIKWQNVYNNHMNAISSDLLEFLSFDGKVNLKHTEYKDILFENLISDIFPFTFLTKQGISKTIDISCYQNNDDILYHQIEAFLLSSELKNDINTDNLNAINKKRI